MVQPPANNLQRIEALLRAGRQLEARQLLLEYLQFDPNSARAWWLMSQAVIDPNQQKDCLQRVLRLDPTNVHARERLEELTPVVNSLPPSSPAVLQKRSTPPTSGNPTVSMLSPESYGPDGQSQIEPPSASPELMDNGKATKIKKPHSRSSRLLEGILVFILILLVAAVILFTVSTGLLPRPPSKFPTNTIPLSIAPAAGYVSNRDFANATFENTHPHTSPHLDPL